MLGLQTKERSAGCFLAPLSIRLSPQHLISSIYWQIKWQRHLLNTTFGDSGREGASRTRNLARPQPERLSIGCGAAGLHMVVKISVDSSVVTEPVEKQHSTLRYVLVYTFLIHTRIRL